MSLKKIDPDKIPVYIQLGTELVHVGAHAIEAIAALFGAGADDVAAWRAKLAADEPALAALVAHLRERVPE